MCNICSKPTSQASSFLFILSLQYIHYLPRLPSNKRNTPDAQLLVLHVNLDLYETSAASSREMLCVWAEIRFMWLCELHAGIKTGAANP